MGIMNFVKGIGDKLFHHDDKAVPQAQQPAEPSAQEIANLLLKKVQNLGIPVDNLSVTYNPVNDTATIRGKVKNGDDREKIILTVGNSEPVATVEDEIQVDEPKPESRMYTVKSGDTLSKIAKEMYGDANVYNKIFEANRPMLSHPDKIFPGQVLRIPV